MTDVVITRMSSSSDNPSMPIPANDVPEIRRVPPDRPKQWLDKGWRDFRHSSGMSLFFSGAYVLGGLVLVALLVLLEWYVLLFPVCAGFLLIAPFCALGLYEISRRLELGLPLEWKDVFSSILRHGGTQIALMGLVLMTLFLAWVWSALALYMLFFGREIIVPSLNGLLDLILNSPQSVAFLVIGDLAGAAFAVTAFAVSVVSLPYLLDRDVDVVTAMMTSVKAVIANPLAMLAWAVSIVIYMFGGFITLFVGIFVALPILGHATWHAYRDLVIHDD